MIGLYYPTWSAPWVSDPSKMDLANLKTEFPDIDVVYLSFCSPDNTYSGGKSFSGTGLQFSMDFNVVVGAIKILKSKGCLVMLSVGGGAYWSSTKTLNSAGCALLMNDLGCDGIDIDWENDASKDYEFTDAINNLDAAISESKKLSCAGFSTGAYGKDGSSYKGMNIDGLVKAGSKLDWINIMTYDAGPPSQYDPLGALDCYRIYYSGPLNIGFEIGTQAWGGYLITRDDVTKNSAYAARNDPRNGSFLWCYKKPGDPGVKEVIELSAKALGKPTPIPNPPTTPKPNPPTPNPIPPTLLSLKCPVCSTVFTKQ